MSHRIPYTSLKGQADKLCSQGNGVEFIQPWYTPISTTPANTGMAVGGIGNTFTLTPLGDTPNFSFIPGIFIDNSDGAVHLNDFYAAVAQPIAIEHLAIADLGELAHFLCYFPVTFSGEPLVIEGLQGAEVLKVIQTALRSGRFYPDNREVFESWSVEFSSKTLSLIQADADAVNTQLHVALDFFDGHLINQTTQSLSLTAMPRSGVLKAIDASRIDYCALYPMAEYTYKAFEPVTIRRKVVTPVVRGDKELCSLPLHWNEFEVTNNSNTVQVVTVVQSLANLLGANYQKTRPGVQDSSCLLSLNPIHHNHQKVDFKSVADRNFDGVLMGSDSPYAADVEGEVLFGVEADHSCSVTVKPGFYHCQHEKVVFDALHTGRTSTHYNFGMYSGRETKAAMVCVALELKPGQSHSVRFAQVMDHSKIELQEWKSHKAYTQFYPESSRAMGILRKVLPQVDDIEAKIIAEQCDYYEKAQHTISDLTLTEKFCTMSMNSLSFLAESTVWDRDDKFLVKECVDYPFFNSLDVYFYGSFSLLYLLPELDACVMREFAEAILSEDQSPRRFWEFADKPNAPLWDAKYQGVRATRGAVIHDLGSPFDCQPDAYNWHNVKEWKDLAPKYLLMVYRNYQRNGDRQLVEDCWPAVVASIDYLSSLIGEGDTLPLTRGTDDTFDNLASYGVSIYCASLWVAGLKAAAVLADLMGDSVKSADYRKRSEAGLATLNQGLWDEEQGYFHFYITPIQSKHLTGHGYQPLTSLGLTLCGDKEQDAATLNGYLDEAVSGTSKLLQRQLRKQQLLGAAPQAFNETYQAILELDSDNSFGDALLADSYLKLMGLEGLFDDQRVERTLNYLYKHNFEINSPRLGVANMTLADGKPCEAFQAQDVWIGVQFSVATALRLAGLQDQAQTLIRRVYDALYQEAKIPFAAPEGFNGSAVIAVDDLMQKFELSRRQADSWLGALKGLELLLSDGRVDPGLTRDTQQFREQIEGSLLDCEAEVLHRWLLNIGLKYTAGRYFRPGMIFAYLPQSKD